MTPLLLLSGAGLPPWIWDEVRASLPSETRVATSPGGDATLADHAASALAAADGWESFGLVAHSIGGVVATAVLSSAPQRITSLVAVAACVPAPGQSFLQTLPFPQRHVVSLLMRAAGTRPPAKEIRDGLCRGVDPAQSERIVAEFRPESQRLYRDPAPVARFPAASVYVRTTQDTQLPPAAQGRSASRLGGRTVTMETAHLPMLQDPRRLARVIADALP